MEFALLLSGIGLFYALARLVCMVCIIMGVNILPEFVVMAFYNFNR
jgi:hypothetical protein